MNIYETIRTHLRITIFQRLNRKRTYIITSIYGHENHHIKIRKLLQATSPSSSMENDSCDVSTAWEGITGTITKVSSQSPVSFHTEEEKV